jgi:hypothetical protein
MGEPARRTVSTALHESGLYGREVRRKPILRKRHDSTSLQKGTWNGADYIMASEEIATVLRAPNQLCYFVSYIPHYLYIKLLLMSLKTEKYRDYSPRTGQIFFFNESNTKDILLPGDQAEIPVIHVKKRQRYRGRRSGYIVRICRRVSKSPLPSVLLANMQSLENKLDGLRSRLSYQRVIKNCHILLHRVVAERRHR